MPRIACLRIPQFQIAVQQKYEQLKDKPLALINGKCTANNYSRARIFMCSTEAIKYGITIGMRLSEAKAQCAALVLLEYDEAIYKMAERKLVTDLISCSPKVSTQEMGIIFLDASGLSFSGGENKFSHQVLKTCSLSGFTDLYIGIADSAFAAMVASNSKRLITIIPQNKDAEFLAPLSINHLKLPIAIEDTLLTLGIKTMGNLAKLPIAELNKRFAKQGAIIWKPWELAQGIDNYQPTLPEREKIFECMLDLGSAVSQFNEILFALKSMLDRLITDLKHEGLLAQELVVSLFQNTNKFDERTLPLIQPTNQSKFLLELIRLSLNAKPLACELTAIKLQVSRFTMENWQQTVIAEDAHTNKQTANTLTQAEIILLQRFATRLGKNKIVQAQASNEYLNENAGVWIAVAKDNNAIKENLLPLDLNYLQEKGYEITSKDLVLRPTSPAIPVLVQLNNKQPAAVNYKKHWYKIKSITNPEYLSCHWWNQVVSKDYYKILAIPIISIDKTTHPNSTFVVNNQQTLLMLLAHDKLHNNWHIEGIYD